MTVAQAVNLLDCLTQNTDPVPPRPFQFHDYTNHLPPTSNYGLQVELDSLVECCDTNQMKISRIKSKVMIFNTRKKYEGLTFR